MPAMTVARRNHASAVVSNNIYVIGGRNEQRQPIASMEFYNIEKNSWYAAASMRDPRTNFSCCVIRNNIYVLGGRGERDALGTIEKYDELMGGWNTVSKS